MFPVLHALLAFVVSLFRSRRSLHLTMLALQHQVAVYQRSGRRPHLQPTDRLFWVWLSRLWTRMAGHVGLRPTSHRHRLAAHTVPGALAATEPGPHAGPSSDLPGCAGADPEDVAGQPHVGCTTHRGRAPEARH